MVGVKVPFLPTLPQDVELHVVALTGRLLEGVRQTLMEHEWPQGSRARGLLAYEAATQGVRPICGR